MARDAAAAHRIFGAEASPYSVKVRSYFRYKGIPHEWVIRNPATEAEFRQYARLPLIPLVVTPEGEGVQDSTPILDRFESLHPEPSIHPGEPVAAFVSALLEEFGDEWCNKWMFHLRWAREVDQLAAAGRLAATMAPEADEATRNNLRDQIRERMVGRVWFVGSNPTTAPIIEDSFEETLGLLEAHLRERPYLFGARPALADFGLYPQIYAAWTDPTGGALVEGRAPSVLAWVQRMLWPRREGDFEPFERLEPTLAPLLERQVGALFIPWTLANEAAVAEGREEFEVELGGRKWVQKPQKYHARSLGMLRERYRAGAGPELDALLARTGCLAAFRGGS